MHIDYGIHLAAGVFIRFAVKKKKNSQEDVLITPDAVGSGWSAIWSGTHSRIGLYFLLSAREKKNPQQTHVIVVVCQTRHTRPARAQK